MPKRKVLVNGRHRLIVSEAKAKALVDSGNAVYVDKSSKEAEPKKTTKKSSKKSSKKEEKTEPKEEKKTDEKEK